MNSKSPKLTLTHLVAIIVSIGIIIYWGNRIQTTETRPQVSVQASASPTSVPFTAKISAPSVEIPKIPATKPTFFASSYILLDHDRKYPLLEKNADTPVAIASTTKIMTALIILETVAPDSVVTISRTANETEGSKADFFTGEKIYARDVLYALMLHSANNAAVALAETSGSVETFVAKMNAKASELGLRNTHYFDPAGLNDDGRSTPRDLAILIDYAIRNPEFKNLVSTNQRTIVSIDGAYKHDVKNSNRLIQSDEPLYLPNVIGGKTGFTYGAGHCLVAVAEFNSKRYVGVILHTSADTKDASAFEMRKLFNWAAKL